MLAIGGLLEIQRFVSIILASGFFIVLGYYIRTIPSPRLWRAIWIFIGMGVIGFPLFIVLIIVLGRTLAAIADFGVLVVVVLVTSAAIGAVVGDRLGKRRNYTPLM